MCVHLSSLHYSFIFSLPHSHLPLPPPKLTPALPLSHQPSHLPSPSHLPHPLLPYHLHAVDSDHQPIHHQVLVLHLHCPLVPPVGGVIAEQVGLHRVQSPHMNTYLCTWKWPIYMYMSIYYGLYTCRLTYRRD